ncbi:MAG: SUMF1/EgtB/PvdO family nonheme iron enzyme [Lentisphaerae bacterium]|nr:SUMF1/EgtB/PvdO family nonheme iron enzyme [Lentisphaerota bacterium]MBT5608731.1 SUMF1/EgtB/PvdO family nonheme iron enzyme [Lentisphaerota bacterium]MBT7062175.1 SUMF1/EgtB/PvdO family nonheme iron enzyme [Lentisphaerota bacterium]MBT7846752.1 SUMF1/EgtB/PvdO family nonheme iron enzyme [Lentisphaerota bacterium]
MIVSCKIGRVHWSRQHAWRTPPGSAEASNGDRRQSRDTHRASNRVKRGGSWNNQPENCRVANRNRNRPENTNSNLGFRVCLAHSSMMAETIVGHRVFLLPVSTGTNTAARRVRHPGGGW